MGFRDRLGRVSPSEPGIVTMRRSHHFLERDATMGDAVIVSACRTAIGTARKGTLLDVSAFDLAKYAVTESLKRSNVPPADVDDVVLGESLQGGGDIARYAAITSGLTDVP